MRAAKGAGSVVKAGKGYRGYVTVDGKRKYTSVYGTKAAADQAKRELLTRRDDGKLTTGKVETVEQWMNHWIENIAKHRPTTYGMNKWVTEVKINPALGKLKLDKLTTERVEQWVADLGIAPSSQRRYLAPLKTALELAVQRGKIAYNPASRIALEKLKKPDTSAFSREDRDAILAAAKGRNRAQWTIALRHGLRPAERLGLTWLDFDAKAGTLTVRNQLLRATGTGFYLQDALKTSTGDGRTIHLPKSTIAMLVEHRREQLQAIADAGAKWEGWEHDGQPVALMFPQANGKPVGAHTDTRAWVKVLEAAGLPDSDRYKARHTAATHMIADSGGDVAVTAKNLGHSDPAFTYRTYVHPLEERERELARRMDEKSAPYAAPYAPSDSEDVGTSTN